MSPSVHCEIVPSFSDMLKVESEYFPFNKTFEEARDDPILVLHSSGSTGVSKQSINPRE
jgi:acyl-coenzyme A synthetase/AMP-(fatty) acid ligase